MDKTQQAYKKKFIQLAKKLFDVGQEGVVIECFGHYRYFKSLEDCKDWGRKHRVFKYVSIADNTPKFNFTIIRYYTHYPHSIICLEV